MIELESKPRAESGRWLVGVRRDAAASSASASQPGCLGNPAPASFQRSPDSKEPDRHESGSSEESAGARSQRNPCVHEESQIKTAAGK